MKREVLLIGDSLEELVDISLHFDLGSWATTVVETLRPVDYLLRAHGSAPDGAIVKLMGSENVAELRSLLEAYSRTTLVFLTAEYPPHAAVARLTSHYGGVILNTKESALVVVATFISLVFQRQSASA